MLTIWQYICILIVSIHASPLFNRMLILLPLTPLSAKIIHAEYGLAQVVSPGRADWLTDVIHINRVGARFTDTELAQVSDSLLLNVPPSVGNMIKDGGQRIGAIIHRLHLEQISRHMFACATGARNATAALQWYYDHYNLSDTELNTESMYREYSRFKKKLLTNSAKKSGHNVRHDSRHWQVQNKAPEQLNFDTLDRICNLLDQQLAAARIRRRKIIGLHAHIYIYSVKGNRDISTIARRFKRHPANIYRAMAHVRKRMRDDERFARAIKPILAADFVLPTPA